MNVPNSIFYNENDLEQSNPTFRIGARNDQLNENYAVKDIEEDAAEDQYAVGKRKKKIEINTYDDLL